MPTCSKCGTHYGATVRICVRDGTPLVAGQADDPYVGRLLDDKYRIESHISSGGMGAVYRAQHVMLGKTVAVKVIKRELVTSDEVVSRFQREARAASNLDHPNIVTVYDLGQAADGTLYIAMEFIDGPSLRDVLRRGGPMEPERAIGILRQVAGALSTAHRRQIVHRDLKSHNLMLAAADDGRDVVKLVDFGIAKTFDEAATQWTQAGYMLGTPHYMSPEQAAGQPVDHRADIYSLGVILYEMLTGEVPFKDDSLTAVLVKLASETPEPPSARRPDIPIPPALEAIAMRCLEKHPDDRFASADEFAAALDEADISAEGAATGKAQAAPPPLHGDATLVRPSPAVRRQGAAPAPAAAPVAHAAMNASNDVPAARVRSGFSMPGMISRRAAVVLVALAAVGAAIATGGALSGDPPVERPVSGVVTEQPEAPVPDTAAEPPAAPTGSLSTRTNADVPAPTEAPVAERSDSANASVTRQPSTPVQSTGERARSGGSVPTAVSTPTMPSNTGAAGAAAQAAAVTPPAVVQQPVVSTPAINSVYVGCEGFQDVCSVVRAEMRRALQRDGLVVASNPDGADVAVTALVLLVSESSSAPFGTPLLIRTYSVELEGESRGVSLNMPDPRRFSFDPTVGAERLAENARLIAADAAQSVRQYRARTQP